MKRNLLLNIIRRERSVTRKQRNDLSGLSVGAVSQIITTKLRQQFLHDGIQIERFAAFESGLQFVGR